jgi:putative cardiolipin synthase
VAVHADAETPLGRMLLAADAHPGESGVFALRDGRDAFAARALLADAAQRTLDVQYYIWHADLSGTLLFSAIRRAADRGVKVRILLDDNQTGGLDAVLGALDAHPNIEVRLFNPFRIRRLRLLGFLIDFARLNRRMHNKSFTVDGQATIVGGRNVGDEYFDAGQGLLFVDLDVLAVGPVVRKVSDDFERYWTSESSLPAARLLRRLRRPPGSQIAAASRSIDRNAESTAYATAVRESPFVQQLATGTLPMEWSTVEMVSDDPAKVLGRAPRESLVWERLRQLLGEAVSELELISPYFVPTARGARYFVRLARQGVKISILTNSLEATDVPAVHSGYAKWRKKLLAAGITLFEVKRAFSPPAAAKRRLTHASASSLHAKTFSIDRARVFVGSFNFDPRSARLNTELGFVIASAALAEATAHGFETVAPASAYRLRLTSSGALQWVEQTVEGERVHEDEPGASLRLRLAVWVLSMLPIEWLL